MNSELLARCKELFAELEATLPKQPPMISDPESAYIGSALVSLNAGKLLLQIIEDQQKEIKIMTEVTQNLTEVGHRTVGQLERIVDFLKEQKVKGLLQ